ncbi:hypothetical protein [Flavobacterium reichenbachii]|uniref:Uncharacterized protein n=1 Tax=Flavobacterium reichenbachii TaxID=362418 RepID=A0A085ZLV5_9FLAO|nr:hypothetical protein [Flavobacterium reichenbachii]KFF05419.1 hypothetical protein IW19_07720 [Flavobacterium reichenbachii]OXB12346.1 hypothetical protein B0A68_19120 [Flavobacterium reichenbachii]
MKDSIIYEVKRKLKEENKELYNSHNSCKFRLLNLRQIILRFSFWAIFSILISALIFVIIYSNKKFNLIIDFIIIDFKELLKLLTSSAITLVSMNLFVTNLLLTHLKEERDDLEKFINKKLPFRFITYFGFSIIIFLLLLNLFYNHLESSKNNILIFLAYSFFIFIGLLIYLYDKVFKFITKGQRKLLISTELKNEFDLNLYTEKFKNIFLESYIRFFENLNFTQTSKNLSSFNSNLIDNVHITFMTNENHYFRDLKYKSLSSLIEKVDLESHFYSVQNLDAKIVNDSEVLLLSYKTNDKKISKESLKSKFIFSKKEFLGVRQRDEVLTIVLEKLEKNIKSGKAEDVGSDLENFKSILEQFYRKY